MSALTTPRATWFVGWSAFLIQTERQYHFYSKDIMPNTLTITDTIEGAGLRRVGARRHLS